MMDPTVPEVAAPQVLSHWEDHRRAAKVAGCPWPGSRAAAACILLRLQRLELDPPAHAVRDPRWGLGFGSYFPDYRAHSCMEYGNRIGAWRLLDWLQPRGWQVAAVVNGLLAREQPRLVRALVDRGLPILAGGWSASRMVSNAVPPEVEHNWLHDTLAAIADATGQRPAGYASQDYGYSSHTPALLEEAGIDHAVDWPSDDMPMAFGPRRRIVMLPVAVDLEDAQAMVARRVQAPRWADSLDAAMTHWRAHAWPGSVLVLSLHAWVAGVPYRHARLRRALEGHDPHAFWQATPQQIVSAWRATQVAAPGQGDH